MQNHIEGIFISNILPHKDCNFILLQFNCSKFILGNCLFTVLHQHLFTLFYCNNIYLFIFYCNNIYLFYCNNNYLFIFYYSFLKIINFFLHHLMEFCSDFAFRSNQDVSFGLNKNLVCATSIHIIYCRRCSIHRPLIRTMLDIHLGRYYLRIILGSGYFHWV